MRVTIIDPNLEAVSGHHFVYIVNIVRELHARGWSVSVVGHERFPNADIFGAQVIRHFSFNGYPAPPEDPIRGYYDDFKERNDATFEELSTLPDFLFAPGTTVLFPTACEYHLFGLVRWAETLGHDRAPQIMVFLMLKSGIELDAEGALQVTDPLRALFYRLALDRAAPLRGRLSFFGTGAIHASEYSALAGFAIPSHPVITNFDETRFEALEQRAAGERPDRILLFAGDAKLDKGLHLVPEVARRIRARFPETPLVVHANFSTAWGPVTELEPVIRALGEEDPGIVVKSGFMSGEGYAELLTSCRAAVFSYDPSEYRRKSSGVLWETIAIGLPVVVPAGTWLEQEVSAAGGSATAYEAWDAEGIAEALGTLMEDIDAQTLRAEAAARAFRERNTVRRLVDRLSEHWLRQGWLQQARSSDQTVTLEVGDPRIRAANATEMLDGSPVRWLADATTITVALAPGTDWSLRMSGPIALGDALERAKLVVDGKPVPVTVIREDGRWVLTGTFRTATSETNKPTEILVTAPAQSGTNDVRKLALLCAAVSFGAPGAFAEQDLQSLSTIRVALTRGPLAESVASDGVRTYTFAGPVGGDALMPVMRESTLALPLLEGIEHAAGLSVLANGQPLQQVPGTRLTFDEILYRIPAGLALSRGGSVAIDVVPPPGASDPFVLRNPRLVLGPASR